MVICGDIGVYFAYLKFSNISCFYKKNINFNLLEEKNLIFKIEGLNIEYQDLEYILQCLKSLYCKYIKLYNILDQLFLVISYISLAIAFFLVIISFFEKKNSNYSLINIINEIKKRFNVFFCILKLFFNYPLKMFGFIFYI